MRKVVKILFVCHGTTTATKPLFACIVAGFGKIVANE